MDEVPSIQEMVAQQLLGTEVWKLEMQVERMRDDASPRGAFEVLDAEVDESRVAAAAADAALLTAMAAADALVQDATAQLYEYQDRLFKPPDDEWTASLSARTQATADGLLWAPPEAVPGGRPLPEGCSPAKPVESPKPELGTSPLRGSPLARFSVQSGDELARLAAMLPPGAAEAIASGTATDCRSWAKALAAARELGCYAEAADMPTGEATDEAPPPPREGAAASAGCTARAAPMTPHGPLAPNVSPDARRSIRGSMHGTTTTTRPSPPVHTPGRVHGHELGYAAAARGPPPSSASSSAPPPASRTPRRAVQPPLPAELDAQGAMAASRSIPRAIVFTPTPQGIVRSHVDARGGT